MRAKRDPRILRTVPVCMSVFLLGLLPCHPIFASARVHIIAAGGDHVEFVPRPEKGYVVGAQGETGGMEEQVQLAGVLPGWLVPENAVAIGGIGRRGLWLVEGQPAPTETTAMAMGGISYLAPLFSAGGETVIVMPEIVVRVHPGIEMRQVHYLFASLGLAVIKPMEFTTQEYLLGVLGADAEAVFAAVEALSQSPMVEWAWPNTAFRPKLGSEAVGPDLAWGSPLPTHKVAQDLNSPGVFPSDEYFPRQWHLYNTGQSGGTSGADIRGPEAWEITTGDPNFIVAVIDTGVDSGHPDLINNLVPGYDFCEDDNQPDPSSEPWPNAHGTACAGLVAAQGNNGIGVTGVTWNCRIMPIRLFNLADATSGAATTEAEIAAALRWAAVHGADVLSNSWVGGSDPMPIVHAAIVDITEPGGLGRNGKGAVVVFGMGDDGQPTTGYPQGYPEAITVGATDHNDARAWYSTYGPRLDVVAPGGAGIVADSVLASQLGDEFLRLSTDLLWTTDVLGDVGLSLFNDDPRTLDYTGKMDGASGATPIAAGVAALILSIEPNLTNDEVRHFLERSAKDLGEPGRDDNYGWGRVDARAALDMVLARRCDLSNDWRVDEQDRTILLKAMETQDLSADIAPAAKRDGKIDQQDLDLLTRYVGTVIPELGLVAHWKLDETAGTTAHDSSGWNEDGTLQHNPVWQPAGGKVDGAIQFDGIDDYVKTPAILDASREAFSVFAWVKGGAPGQVILSQVGRTNWLSTDPSAGWLVSDLKPADRNGRTLWSQATITDGNWHRIGLAYDGSRPLLTLYVDAIGVAEAPQVINAPNSSGVFIGAGGRLTRASHWSGLIDDVRIYDRAVKP